MENATLTLTVALAPPDHPAKTPLLLPVRNPHDGALAKAKPQRSSFHNNNEFRNQLTVIAKSKRNPIPVPIGATTELSILIPIAIPNPIPIKTEPLFQRAAVGVTATAKSTVILPLTMPQTAIMTATVTLTMNHRTTRAMLRSQNHRDSVAIRPFGILSIWPIP